MADLLFIGNPLHIVPYGRTLAEKRYPCFGNFVSPRGEWLHSDWGEEGYGGGSIHG